MRQETNKEIDLLLRRMSGRDGEAAREREIDDGHLDADELSSYAQNVLPPAARARYMEHLVECSTCRRLATELSLALGSTTVAAPVETVSPASGLKKFLASLFTPLVLRYAVPALGVILVTVIGFVVLRQREARTELVTQIATQPAPAAGPEQPAVAPLPEAQQKQQAETRALAKAPNEAPPEHEGESGGTAGGGAETKAEESKTGSRADSAAAAPAAVAPVTVATPSDVQPYTSRSVSELPVVNPTPLPSAPKAGIATDGIDDTKAKKESVAKREVKQQGPGSLQSANEKKQANEVARDSDKERPAKEEAAAADRADQNKAKAGARTETADVAGRAYQRDRRQDSKDEAETRSIAGRKFRKERGIWTDTAYDSATGTINMGRGSEQFRSLVADEPAIKRIAEQLDGEVIVVWKGRAYRIR